MNIILANPRGFCAGVERAIEILNTALSYFTTVYVKHEIVHNRFVVDDFKKRGVIFIENLNEVPEGQLVIFSAHGVSKSIEKQAKARNLQVVDATCPLVTKVHLEVVRFQRENRFVLMIGHAGHPEVEGTLGRYNTSDKGGIYLIECVEDIQELPLKKTDPVACITQTTLSVDDTHCIISAIEKHFVNLEKPKTKDICYATQNRQDAVKKLIQRVDVLFVLGSKNSSNSNRLQEIAATKIPAYRIDNAIEIQEKWLKNVTNIGITSGASAPEVLVNRLLDYFKKKYDIQCVEVLDQVQENVHFSTPDFSHLRSISIK